jgi:hypothetical protein
MKRLTHEQLLAGEGYTTSIINEPLTSDGAPPHAERESASKIAKHRWFNRGQADDRRDR